MKPLYSNPWFFITLCLVIPVMAFTSLKWYNSFERLPVFHANKPIDSFSLSNQYRQTVNINKWEGKIMVVKFFFTHCPVVCPKMTSNMQAVQNYYGRDSLLQFISLTVDPERDNSDRLLEYMRQHAIQDYNWTFFTGDKKQIYQLARNQFELVATESNTEIPDFIHSDKLVLIDRQKKIRGYYRGTSDKDIKQLITDIKKLQHESSTLFTKRS